jgi:hypothetical protein
MVTGACSVSPSGLAGDGTPPPLDASVIDDDAGSPGTGANDGSRGDRVDAIDDGPSCEVGTCPPAVLASGQSQPLSIAVDGQHVFWTNASSSDGTGSVMRADLDGADVVALASGRNRPFGIALDDTDVYWSEQGTMAASFTDGVLYRLGKGGSCTRAPCPPPIIGGQAAPAGIAVDEASIYFARAGDGTVWRWGKDGSTGALLSSSESSPLFVAVGAAGLFWTDEGTSAASFADGLVRKAIFDAGAVSIAASQSLTYGIALDATDVYWTDLYGGTVNRAPQAGGPATPIVSGSSRPVAVAVGGGWVYFAVQGPMGSANRGAIEAVRTDGTCPGSPCPLVLASGRSAPWAVAVDASFVYWTEPGAGNVMRVAR